MGATANLHDEVPSPHVKRRLAQNGLPLCTSLGGFQAPLLTPALQRPTSYLPTYLPKWGPLVWALLAGLALYGVALQPPRPYKVTL